MRKLKTAFFVILPLAFVLLAVVRLAVGGWSDVEAVIAAPSAWGRFFSVRVWFASRGVLPLRLMTFLRDAYERGVLRRTGPYYQFRHELLQDQAAAGPAPPVSGPPAPPATKP
ncbi:hypothetical protein AB0J35_07835 [Nonomuraea angiospora]|uniref:hypothetical protein n=1 Tax=Nonomuraea angiospora TaxID=46172 RepID=UPI003444D793